MKNKLNVLINIFFPIWIILTIALLLGCLAPLVDRYFSKPHSSDEAMSLSLAAVTSLQKSFWRGTAHYYYSNAVPGALAREVSRDFAPLRGPSRGGRHRYASRRFFRGPRYTILDDGTGNDDHPHADIREGDFFLYRTFTAVAKGPQWASTVFILNFDEWGGFFAKHRYRVKDVK
jgi:hypothetical protein